MFKMKIVIVILTALLNISVAVKTNHNLCPFQLLCSCINVNGTKTVTVTCQGMRNLMSVKNVVKHLKSKPIKLLKVKRCAEKNLAFPVFNNLTIFEIRINCPLRTIADKAFVETHSLTRLKISSSSLQKIPAAINQVKALKTLAIVGGRLTRIGGRLQNMTELEKLSLKHNRIKEITAHTFSGDKKLQSIILARNKLRSIAPGTFDPCPNLNLVDLEDNYLQTVDGLFNNPNLKVINLKRNDLTSLEEAFNDIMDIEELHLNGNKNLTYISDKALGFNLHNLLKLSLRECGLEKVSKAFLIPFSHLEELDLSCNSLRIIPDGFFNNLENLIKVNLQTNRLRSVRNCFGQNYRLEHIDLSDNLIESCDNTFHSMASLKSIDLSRNRLRRIKNTDFSTSPWLRKLSLNINNISQIDSEAFSHLKQLQIINLSENELKNLNGSFRNTPYLRELILHSNGLGELNENDFSAAGRVTRLNLANTNLSRVHGAFKNLSNLKSLTIRKNKLSVLSRESFPRIIKIREMFSSENKWICDCRLLWIKDWMQNTNLRNLNLDFNCSLPIHFKSKKLSQLTKADLVSWPKDDCPSPCECSCVADGEERYVNVNCSSRELREIPTKFPELIGELNLRENMLSNPIKLNLPSTSKLKILNLESNLIARVDFKLPNNIEVLLLANNNITRFIDYPPSNVKTFTLSRNPWYCDCDTLPFRKWMIAHESKITDANETVCSYRDGKESLRGRLIMNLSEIELCPELLRNYILMGAGSLMTLMMTVTSFVVYFRYRYHLRVWLYSRGFRCLKNRDKRDTGKLYDAYISFSDEDAEMVRHHFLPELEEKHPFYKLFVPQRDLKAGNFEINNLMEQVLDSKRAIILLSRHYLKNEFCMEIFRVAFANSLEEKLHRVILVKFGPLPPMNHEPSTHEPSTMMESSRSLKFGTRLFWDMLQYEMPEKRPRSTNNYELLDDKSGDVPLIEEF